MRRLCLGASATYGRDPNLAVAACREGAVFAYHLSFIDVLTPPLNKFRGFPVLLPVNFLLPRVHGRRSPWVVDPTAYRREMDQPLNSRARNPPEAGVIPLRPL